MKNISITHNFVLLILVSIYICSMYFSAATASLDNSYQPGIEELQSIFDPAYVTLVLLVIVLVVRRIKLSIFVKRFYVVALFLNVILGIFVSTYNGKHASWVFPENRTFSGTIQQSLFQPSFSGRSIGRVVFNGVIIVLSLGVTSYVARKNA